MMEESWYLLNLIGFQEVPYEIETIEVATDLAGERSIYKTFRSRRHQDNRHVRRNIESVFTDNQIWNARGLNRQEFSRLKWDEIKYHEPIKPLRDRSIKIAGPKLCVRCKRDGKGPEGGLQRDHIIQLSDGGKDVAENLQWLCSVCHRWKTTRVKLEAEIPHHKQGYWRRKMWEFRLEIHNQLNPPGADRFHSYGENPKTLWAYWSVWHIDGRKKVKDSTEMNLANEQMTLDILNNSTPITDAAG